MAALPYVTAHGNIEKALKGIKAAATPETVSQDFVKTILGIKGGSGNQMTAYLKKIGFASQDGAPTNLYKKFRNSASEGWAAAEALRTGYAPLFVRNEFVYKLSDEELKGLITEETGAEKDSAVASMVLACIKQLKKYAKWDPPPAAEEKAEKPGTDVRIPTPERIPPLPPAGQRLGLNLGYTINLNLPATSDPAVFSAIFRALKEHLLKVTNE